MTDYSLACNCAKPLTVPDPKQRGKEDSEQDFLVVIVFKPHIRLFLTFML